MHRLIKLSLCLLTISLTACTQHGWYPFLYKPEVQQGNVISDPMLGRLKIGMSSDQVRFLMGDPVLHNVFDQHHWNYVYYLQPSKGKVVQQYLILYFSNDKLTQIEQGK